MHVTRYNILRLYVNLLYSINNIHGCKIVFVYFQIYYAFWYFVFFQIRIIITIIISICGNYLSRRGSYCFDHFKIRSFVIYFISTFTPSFCGPQLTIFIHFDCNRCVLCMCLLYILYTIFLLTLSVSILFSNICWDSNTSF